MDQLLATVSQMTGLAPGTLVLGSVFGAVFMVIVGAASVMGQRGRVKRRLAGEAAPEVRPRASLRDGSGDSAWHALVKSLESKVGPNSEEERSKLRSKLLQAGYMSPNAVSIFYAVRLPMAIVLPIGFLLFGPTLFGAMPTQKLILIAAILGLVGMYLPNYWLSKKVAYRQRKISEGFPDALDMLVVCTEAGLGLDASFQRVGSQIGRAHPELSEQLAWISLEMRAGKSRQDALRNLARRIGLPEIRSFVTLLIQSDALGASIAQTLRVNSDEMRVKRTLKAEEKAHKLPVKLSVPLVAFILPSIIMVVLLPGIITIIRNLLPALNGG